MFPRSIIKRSGFEVHYEGVGHVQCLQHVLQNVQVHVYRECINKCVGLCYVCRECVLRCMGL